LRVLWQCLSFYVQLELKPSRLGGVLVLLIGLAFLTSSNYMSGAALAAGAAAYLYFKKTVFHVLLSTSGGETKALKTYQRAYLNKVLTALNEAIVYRG